MAQSRGIYAGSDTRWFVYHPDAGPEKAWRAEPGRFDGFEWQGAPLGALVLPSMRWVLRRHHLQG
jgi:hypothetical protein